MFIKTGFILMFTLALADTVAADCNPAVIKSTPDEAFTLHNNGTVTHNKTGLMWMRCQLGQTWNGNTCGGSGKTYTWQGALQVSQGFTFAGYSDWRLPNKNELASILEQACDSFFDDGDGNEPTINMRVFPNASNGNVWSSTPYAADAKRAWVVGFLDNSVDDSGKTNRNEIRLVRGGQ